ncbi:hypothetical protein CEUSTIGMA_g11472.t1 [Chlamydomonas eustigma]|uniref:Uncharacterized protein n=1 Tax=Chlamydomonas eustigma TaxID=1157962 RepID=A0A250XLU8_9CHLO|nr:hypothetical protein CEUSTIGMA_g11472.t1 [Chlamydomonas eustigma]|eukprot:GAX84048.1 hypothetical protein CEUSTIGMA_g11472.t1 [Chlamydomonas eustigma]
MQIYYHLNTGRTIRNSVCSRFQKGHLEGVPAAVKLIVSDVDGTLLNSRQQLTPAVEAAIKESAKTGVPLVVATGKARGPWTKEVFLRLGLNTPGVFLQGLLVCDAEGNLLYERTLEFEICIEAIKLADQRGITLTAYCGGRILAAVRDSHTDRLLFYKEPDVEAVGPLQEALRHVTVHKLIFMTDQSEIDLLRPVAEEIFRGRATLTTAIEGMLEVLPLGASKGSGVAWLLDHLGVDAHDIMAIGDGENDIEMLQMAGMSVAMGNASKRVQDAADVRVSSNDEDGVAEAIKRYVINISQ